MEILCSIASYFCKGTNEKRPVVAKAVYKNGDVREFKAAANRYEDYFGADSKAYVLADSGSASASEKKAANSPSASYKIDRRIKELTPMLQKCRDLAELTARYYERSYHKHERYTL